MFDHVKRYLTDNPHFGIAGGGGSLGIKWLSSILSIQGLMEVIGLIGASAGAGVALLTLALKAIELWDVWKARRVSRKRAAKK